MAGWDIALDEQNALAHSFATREGRQQLLGFAESIAQGQVRQDTGEEVADEDRLPQAMDMTLVAAVSVREGEPIFVSRDVTDLVEFAAETFKPEPLRWEDLMIPNGFMWLERPLYMIDRHDKATAFRAVSWMQSEIGRKASDQGRVHREPFDPENLKEGSGKRPGVAMAFWSHLDDADDYFPEGIAKAEGITRIGGSPLVLMHVANCQYGSSVFLNEDTHRDLLTTMQCLWRLMQQKIVMQSRENVSRAAWRRKTNWRQVRQIVVMKLRRAKHKGDEPSGSEVEWSHQWWVNAYWQTRHVRDKGSGKLITRQILVSGHVKGPEDKPFVPKQRAVEFVR